MFNRNPNDISQINQVPSQRGNNYSHLTDPIVQAGFGIASGRPISEAITQAAAMQHQQAQTQLHQQQYEQKQQEMARQQLISQSLPQILSQLDPTNFQGNIAALQQAGLDQNEALVFASKLAENAQPKMSPLEQKLALEGEKKANRLEEKKIAKQEKFVEENDAKAQDAHKFLNNLDKLEGLTDKFHQGALSGVAQTVNKYQPFFGAEEAAAYEEFDSTAKDLALETAKRMKGVLSDKDIAFLEKTVPSTGHTKQGNKQIIERLRKVAERELEYTQKANEWIEAGGDVKEFEKRWRQYMAKNPIFDSEEKMKEKKENKRMEDFSSLSEEDIEAEIRKLESGG